jgi:hypothetical protein
LKGPELHAEGGRTAGPTPYININKKLDVLVKDVLPVAVGWPGHVRDAGRILIELLAFADSCRRAEHGRTLREIKNLLDIESSFCVSYIWWMLMIGQTHHPAMVAPPCESAWVGFFRAPPRLGPMVGHSG